MRERAGDELSQNRGAAEIVNRTFLSNENSFVVVFLQGRSVRDGNGDNVNKTPTTSLGCVSFTRSAFSIRASISNRCVVDTDFYERYFFFIQIFFHLHKVETIFVFRFLRGCDSSARKNVSIFFLFRLYVEWQRFQSVRLRFTFYLNSDCVSRHRCHLWLVFCFCLVFCLCADTAMKLNGIYEEKNGLFLVRFADRRKWNIYMSIFVKLVTGFSSLR